MLPTGDSLSTTEVAARCRVDRTTVGDWIRVGVMTASGRVRLTAWRAGCSWRIEPAALAAFLDALSPGRQEAIAGQDADMLADADRAARELGWR
jgi:hypothetical protein